MEQVHVPLFKKADLDATIGTFFDGFSKVVVALSLLVGTLGLDSSTVLGTMMPGLLVTTVVLNGGMWAYYRHLARRCGDPDLTAIPAGLQAVRLFVWLFSIMLPVYQTTGDAMLAFRVGVLAHFLSGFVFLAGAFVMPLLLRVVPAGALFGSLAGGSMAYLVLQSMNGTLAMPLAGWLTLVVLFVFYLGRVDTKLPAALIAVAVGAVVAWASGAMSVEAVVSSVSAVGLYLPAPATGIFAPEVFEQVVHFVPVIVVFTLDEVITGIQGVEQAREAGDARFTTTAPLVIAGVASVVGALFGNPLAPGVYWGHPGWKRLGAGTGYHLGVIALYAVVGLSGLAAVITALVPEAVVLPILAFVGISSYAQAFEVVDRRYYPAVIMASLPVVMSLVSNNASEGALPGFAAFAPGAAFTALLVGCLFVFVIDNDWLKASVTNVAALALTLVGMIHSPGPVLTDSYVFETDFVVAYAALAAGFLALHVLRLGRRSAGRRFPSARAAKAPAPAGEQGGQGEK